MAKQTKKKSTTTKKKAQTSRSKLQTPKSASKKATRKKTVKKTTKRSTKVKSKAGLTNKELNAFKELLVEKMHELLGDVNQIEAGSLKDSRGESIGDLSFMPIHMADMGSDNFEQEFALGLMDSERKLLKEIVDALNRIEDGTYGVCEGMNKPIGKARLEAKPWARYSIEYAQMVEKGLVIEGEKIYEEDEIIEEEDEDSIEQEDTDSDYEEEMDDELDEYDLDLFESDNDEPDIDFSDDNL